MVRRKYRSARGRDRDLARRMCRGDASATAEFCRTYLPKLLRFARARVDSEGDADAVVQNVVRGVARDIATYRSDATLLSRLLLICCRELIERDREALARRSLQVHSVAGRGPSGEGDDALIRRVFALSNRDSPAPPRPSRESLQRAEDAFRAALAPVVLRRRRRRLRVVLGCAAAVGALFVAVASRWSVVTLNDSLATVVKSSGPVAIVGRPIDATESRTVHRNELLVTSASGRAALDYAGLDVRVDSGTILRFDGANLILRRGMVYVDSHTHGWWPTPTVHIETPFGSVTDSATQFITHVDSNRMIVAVRRGSVIVRSATRAISLTAGEHHAAIARADVTGRIQVVAAPTFGAFWSWVPTLSRGFVASGHSVGSYLRWLGKEHGYALRYGDSASEMRANVLHLRSDLDLRDLSIEEAADLVSTTTSLDVQPDDLGVLHVTSDGTNGAAESLEAYTASRS